MKRKKCPICGAGVFYVTAHVTQDWEVDEYGNFINTVDDCVEVTHHADDDDMWECVNCGHNALGREFNVEGIKTYKINYKEILKYEFYVDAESKEQAEAKFRKMAHDGEVSFDDGWVEHSDIESIEEDV